VEEDVMLLLLLLLLEVAQVVPAQTDMQISPTQG
jgi:hypothetical protein